MLRLKKEMEDVHISEQTPYLSLELVTTYEDDNQSKPAEQEQSDEIIPNISEVPITDFQCKVGETIHLEGISGNGPFKWMFNGLMLDVTSREFIKEGAAFTDSGEYECQISDGNVLHLYKVCIYEYLFRDDFLGIRTSVTGQHTAGEFRMQKVVPSQDTKNLNKEAKTNINEKGNVMPPKNRINKNKKGNVSLNKYGMTRNPRGIAVIIAIEKFETLPALPGIKHDIENCKKAFKSLHFEVLVCEQKKAKDIIQYLKNVANTDHTNYDGFILYISSHGMSGLVCCEDFKEKNEQKINTKREKEMTNMNNVNEEENGYILFYTLLELFLPNHCPGLKEKPKMFFFDCCRNVQDIAANCQSPIRVFNNNGEQSKHYEDIFIGYATVNGDAAEIIESGSVYTTKLTQWLERMASTKSLLDVMVQVTYEMRGVYAQLPHQENTLSGQVIMERFNVNKQSRQIPNCIIL